MSFGERLARFFVAPVAEVGEEVRWVPPGAPAPSRVRVASLAVVCAPRDARTAGGAAALALAQHTGAPAVLVLEWTGADPKPGADRPATPSARRLAARYGAGAAGRLARIVLEGDELAAATRAAEVLRGSDAPVVLVAAGPRGDRMEALLAQQDRSLLVARANDDLAPLAAERLRATLVTLPSSPGAAALARGGSALLAPLRRPFLEAVSG